MAEDSINRQAYACKRFRACLGAFAAATFIAAGCGSDGGEAKAPAPQTEEPTTTIESEPTTTQHATTTQPKKPKPKFTGVHAENYRIHYTSCGIFSPKQIAKEYGITATDPVTVAQRYAEIGYRPAFRQAVFEGCLDAFIGRPPKVKGAP